MIRPVAGDVPPGRVCNGSRVTASGHFDSWAQQRVSVTGDWASSDPTTVARDVETVLTGMRRRPDWYQSYVERPLGHKRVPTYAIGNEETNRPVPPTELQQDRDAELLRLASDAVEAIGWRLQKGDKAEEAVVEVLQAVFLGNRAVALDRVPHVSPDPVDEVSGVLADPATLDRIVAAALNIIRE